jgi:hypothetical protein
MMGGNEIPQTDYAKIFGSANSEDTFIGFLNSIIELDSIQKIKDFSLLIRTALLIEKVEKHIK